mgnify:CR=1 FL=1
MSHIQGNIKNYLLCIANEDITLYKLAQAVGFLTEQMQLIITRTIMSVGPIYVGFSFFTKANDPFSMYASIT